MQKEKKTFLAAHYIQLTLHLLSMHVEKQQSTICNINTAQQWQCKNFAILLFSLLQLWQSCTESERRDQSSRAPLCTFILLLCRGFFAIIAKSEHFCNNLHFAKCGVCSSSTHTISIYAYQCCLPVPAMQIVVSEP